MKKQFDGQAWIGNVRYKENSELVISSNTTIDTPIYKVGVDIDDQILKLDGKSVKKEADIKAILDAHKPGDEIELEYLHRKDVILGMIKLVENPRLIVLPNEKADLPVSDGALAVRKRWIESKVK